MNNCCYSFIVAEPKCVHSINAMDNWKWAGAKSLHSTKAHVSKVRVWTFQSTRAICEHISSPWVSVYPFLLLCHLFSTSHPPLACRRVCHRFQWLCNQSTDSLRCHLCSRGVGLCPGIPHSSMCACPWEYRSPWTHLSWAVVVWVTSVLQSCSASWCVIIFAIRGPFGVIWVPLKCSLKKDSTLPLFSQWSHLISSKDYLPLVALRKSVSFPG